MKAVAAAAFALFALGLAVPAAAQTAPAPPASAPTPPAAPPTPPPPACTTPEHRQFDFWVGRWDVYPTGTDQLVAHSLVENLYAGCVIRENWMPLQGPGGSSLNAWRPRDRRWRQTWADGVNNYDDFSGGLEDGAMVLTIERILADGSRARDRMRFSREPGNAVRQHGTRSTDSGATWQTLYDFTYRPAGETSAD
ncbi:MAG: hypothetical protein ACXWU1_09215 [Allosphingosinicella sp.]